MDLTGAGWSLGGTEAVLRLRSIYASGDWQDYWAFHEQAEYERNHRIHYAHPERLEKPRLRLVKYVPSKKSRAHLIWALNGA